MIFWKRIITLLAVSSLAILFFVVSAQIANAGLTHNVSGFAWSDNIGWISFNSTDCDRDGNGTISQAEADIYTACPVGGTPSYGVTIDAATGAVTGYAWSDNIGWVQFGGLSGFPTGGGTTAENAKLTGPAFTGWARAISAVGRTDGWDGWIALSGTNFTSSISDPVLDGSAGVTHDALNGRIVGYAWGGDVVGWVDFNQVYNNEAGVSYSSWGDFQIRKVNENLDTLGDSNVFTGIDGFHYSSNDAGAFDKPIIPNIIPGSHTVETTKTSTYPSVTAAVCTYDRGTTPCSLGEQSQYSIVPTQIVIDQTTFWQIPATIQTGKVTKVAFRYSLTAPVTNGSIEITRVNFQEYAIQNTNSQNAGPSTSAAVDSTTSPKTQNPAPFSPVSSGGHIAYTTKVSGYSITAGTATCSGLTADSSCQPITSFTSPVDCVSNPSYCFATTSVSVGKLTRVVFKYIQNAPTTGSLQITRVNSQEVAIQNTNSQNTGPSTSAALDSSASPTTTNPASYNDIVQGSHVAFSKKVSGYTITAGTATCSGLTADSSCQPITSFTSSIDCSTDPNYCKVTTSISVGKLTRVVFKYTAIPPSSTGVIRVRRVGPDEKPNTLPSGTTSRLNGTNQSPTSTNPYSYPAVSVGSHTVGVTQRSGYTVVAGSCTYPTSASSDSCTVPSSAIKVLPSCSGGYCSIATSTEANMVNRVVFQYTPTLGVVCSAWPATAQTRQQMNWRASAYGGVSSSIAPYSFSWTGTDGLSSTKQSFLWGYVTPGTKQGIVTVRSGTVPPAQATCTATIVAGPDDNDPYDYSLEASGDLTIGQGESGMVTITRTKISTSQDEAVSISTGGYPSDNPPAETISNNPCTPRNQCSSDITITADPSSSTGDFQITVEGTSQSGVQKSTSFILTITDGSEVLSQFDYSLSNSGNISVVKGDAAVSGNTTISALLTAGTAQSVSFSGSGLPSGVSASFAPTTVSPTSPVTSGARSTLALTVSPSVPVGTYPITVTGLPAGAGGSRTTQFNLVVGGRSCVGPDGAVIPHGAGKRYYKNATEPAGTSCQSELRICNDGTLSSNNSPAYVFPQCSSFVEF